VVSHPHSMSLFGRPPEATELTADQYQALV
jgi:hypothetical protein